MWKPSGQTEPATINLLKITPFDASGVMMWKVRIRADKRTYEALCTLEGRCLGSNRVGTEKEYEGAHQDAIGRFATAAIAAHAQRAAQAEEAADRAEAHGAALRRR